DGRGAARAASRGSGEERRAAHASPFAARPPDVQQAEGLRRAEPSPRGPEAAGPRVAGLIGIPMANEQRVYATGRRKEAVARVWLQPGEGKITINDRDLHEYFGRETTKMILMQPLELTDLRGKVDVWVNVGGGGLSGQAG